jgi:hypothetical protein
MSKVAKIIEYQHELQYTPKELCEFITEDMTNRKDLITGLFIYRTENGLFFTSGSQDRDYDLKKISWDLDQLKLAMLQGDLI